MGFFSSLAHDITDPFNIGVSSFLTHDVFDPISSMFGGNNSTLTSAIAAQTQALTAATTAATTATQQAQAEAEAAATPPTDSESSRQASDDQLRKSLAGGVYGVGMPATTGAAPVGYRLLSGSS